MPEHSERERLLCALRIWALAGPSRLLEGFVGVEYFSDVLRYEGRRFDLPLLD
jgi:hypothetical protein